MPKEITPSGRGLEPELDNFDPNKIPVSKKKVVIEDEPSSEPDIPEEKPAPVSESKQIFQKVVEFGKGYLIVQTNQGKIKLSNGTLAWRNNNPGNIKYGPFAKENGAIGEGGQDLAVFPTYEDGEAAQIKLLFGEDSSYKNLTLQQAIYKYAPTSDGNDPKEYTNFVAKKSGISKTMIMGKLTKEKQKALVDAMHIIEGFQKGKVTKL